MRSDDCPTVVRMGGHVHPRYPAAPVSSEPLPKADQPNPPPPKAEVEDDSDPF